MNTNKTRGRVVGVLFLLLVILGSTSLDFRGLSTSLTESEGFLKTVLENSFDMRLAILLDFLAAAIWVGIFIVIYPVLKKQLRSMSLWYLGFGFLVIYFGIIITSNISHLSLIALSQEFSNASNADVDHFRILGKLKVKDYYSAHFFGLITYSMGAAALFYALFKSKLVPQFLSAWGMLAMTVVFTATWFQIFGQKVSFNFYLQNGVHILFFTIWLLVKGFSQVETDSSKE